MLLLGSAAHHGSVLRDSRHGHVHNLAVLDQRSPSLHSLTSPEILLEEETSAVDDRLSAFAARERGFLPHLLAGCAEDLRSAGCPGFNCLRSFDNYSGLNSLPLRLRLLLLDFLTCDNRSVPF